MKSLFTVAVLAGAMALTACGGGDSDSSGSSYTEVFKKTLANGNQYTCGSEAVAVNCTSDTTCKAANCTLTKQVTTPTPTPSTPPCTISGSNIYGTKGASCTFSIANVNNGATQTLVCDVS